MTDYGNYKQELSQGASLTRPELPKRLGFPCYFHAGADPEPCRICPETHPNVPKWLTLSLRHPTNGLCGPTQALCASTHGLCASTEELPKSGVPAPKSGVPAPKSGVPAPKSGVPAPKSGVPARRSGVPAPQGGGTESTGWQPVSRFREERGLLVRYSKLRTGVSALPSRFVPLTLRPGEVPIFPINCSICAYATAHESRGMRERACRASLE